MKRKLPPDTRLDWRDPNMPVLRYRKSNGKVVIDEVSPEHITNYYKARLEQIGWLMPDWDKDPSYWWSKNKSKKL